VAVRKNRQAEGCSAFSLSALAFSSTSDSVLMSCGVASHSRRSRLSSKFASYAVVHSAVPRLRHPP